MSTEQKVDLVAANWETFGLNRTLAAVGIGPRFRQGITSVSGLERRWEQRFREPGRARGEGKRGSVVIELGRSVEQCPQQPALVIDYQKSLAKMS